MIDKIPPMSKKETADFYNFGKVPERFQTPEQKNRERILDYFIRESTPELDRINSFLAQGGYIPDEEQNN